jgi:hypothetical protein
VGGILLPLAGSGATWLWSQRTQTFGKLDVLAAATQASDEHQQRSDEKLTQTITKIDGVRVEMRQGFADVGRRIDGLYDRSAYRRQPTDSAYVVGPVYGPSGGAQ